jgi:hypothetical protein
LSTATWAQPEPILQVVERSGVPRDREVVVFGVPLPERWNLTNTQQLRLIAGDGAQLPAQFEILARWGGAPGERAKAAKWVLVACPQTLPAKGTNRLWLSLDSSGTSAPAPSPALSIGPDAPGLVRIDTGIAQFIVNTNHFTLFERVVIEGTAVITTVGETETLLYEGIDGLNLVGGRFTRPVRATQWTWDRQGPIYAVAKLRGSLLDRDGQAILDYTVRYHFYAGRSDVRVDVTVENHHPVLVGESGEPLNIHDQGSTNSVYLGSLTLSTRFLKPGSGMETIVEGHVAPSPLIGSVRWLQESSGTEWWNKYVGLTGWETNVDARPRLQAFCRARGFTIKGLGETVSGDQALGWMAFQAREPAGPRLLVALQDAWQNFPKALEARTDGRLLIDLFPEGSHFRHNLRVGEQKTHTIYFDVGRGPEAPDRLAERARAYQRPLFGCAAPEWMCASGVLGQVPVRQPAIWPLYEHYVNLAFEPNPGFDPELDDPSFGNTTLQEVVRRHHFYGWQDYGDVPLDYEAFGPDQAGQMNLKYWYLYGMLVQFTRSGDGRWLDLAWPAARHLADIDYLHIPDQGIEHWSHGAYFGHSNHDEPGNTNPNRNSNSPSVDLFFGVPDLLLAYCLSGESRYYEVAREGLAAMESLSQFSDFAHPVLYRERANLIFAYVEGYRMTGDRRWLENAQAVVRETARLENKSWLQDPARYRPEENWHWQSSFQLCQVSWALGRYLDLCREYALPDDLGVAPALGAYADALLRHFAVEYVPGRKANRSALFFFDPPDEAYLEINNWALTAADMLAYAYTYTGRTNYLREAGMFFATGTIDPVWQDDPPVYLASKDLVNALNWGLVYMALTEPSSGTNEVLHLGARRLATQRLELFWSKAPASRGLVLETALDLARPDWQPTPLSEADSTNYVYEVPLSDSTSRFWRLRLSNAPLGAGARQGPAESESPNGRGLDRAPFGVPPSGVRAPEWELLTAPGEALKPSSQRDTVRAR